MMMHKFINRNWMRCHPRQNPVIIQIFLGLLTASHGKECILFEFEFAVFPLLFAPCDSEEEKRSASSRVSQRCTLRRARYSLSHVSDSINACYLGVVREAEISVPLQKAVFLALLFDVHLWQTDGANANVWL